MSRPHPTMANSSDSFPLSAAEERALKEELPPFYVQSRRTSEELIAPISTPTTSISDYSDTPDLKAYRASGKALDASADINAYGGIDVKLRLKQSIPSLPPDYALSVEESYIDPNATSIPSLSILIQIVGSRGDVQPYLSLAIELVLCSSRHRVRIATHDDFREFVLGDGRRILRGRLRSRGGGGEEEAMGRLEFYPIGGSPKDLMAYMVKNPGLIPGIESIRKGDIGAKQKMLKEIMHNCFLSTFHPDPLTGRSFTPDLLLCNPPSFAHVHLAESFGLPLMISFTMPWSPTTAFNHPLVNIQSSNADASLTNYFTYGLAEIMTWQGLSGIINKYRKRDLKIRPLANREGPGIADRLKIPHMYCWSPSMIPKPEDWKQHIDIVGCFFMEDSEYEPEPELIAFLEAGPPPIYIGFGSIVVDDPVALTATIFEAVRISGVRALVSAGWSKIGGPSIPPNIFILGNIPHDWLFSHNRVSAVCHHGGAGTTACGLRNGRPTIVVPFFGDQPWQGKMVHAARAGPEPIPFKQLTAENLSRAILSALTPEATAAAALLGAQIRSENGELAGVASIHAHLPLLNMRCDLSPTRVAHYWTDKFALRLSGFAAETLIEGGLIKRKHLQHHRPREYDSIRDELFPLAGGVNAVFNAAIDMTVGTAQLFYKPTKGLFKLGTFMPIALYDMLLGVNDFLYEAPKYWGSPMPKSRVDGIASGFAEGGKAFWYGMRDGLGGLVTTPMKRNKEKPGGAGIAIGIGQSWLDFYIKPLAGLLGLVAQPIRGMAIAASGRGFRQNHPFDRPRAELGKEEYEKSTEKERQAIIDAFNTSLTTITERKETILQRLQTALQLDKDEREEIIKESGIDYKLQQEKEKELTKSMGKSLPPLPPGEFEHEDEQLRWALEESLAMGGEGETDGDRGGEHRVV